MTKIKIIPEAPIKVTVQNEEKDRMKIKLEGAGHALGNHTDTVFTNPATGQILRFDGTNWINGVEADPVFMASPASTVTNLMISNWNTSYSWGNHALAGYLTSFTELDPVFSASPAAGVTNLLISNWNTAYSSAHAALTLGTANGLSLVGQVLSMAEATALVAGVVSIGAQTFAGSKTFNGATVTFANDVMLSGTTPNFSHTGGGVFRIQSSTGNIRLNAVSAQSIDFHTTNTLRWQITAAGVLANVSGLKATLTYDNIAVTQTDVLELFNMTAATSGVTRQNSPAINWSGRVWNTTTLSSDTINGRLFLEGKSDTNSQLESKLMISLGVRGTYWSDAYFYSKSGLASIRLNINYIESNIQKLTIQANQWTQFTGQGQTSGPMYDFICSTAPLTNNGASESVFMQLTQSWAASSGSAQYAMLKLSPTISQTGGTGITRALWINSTLTTPFDYRSIETTIGNILLITGAGAYSMGVGVASTSALGARFHVRYTGDGNYFLVDDGTNNLIKAYKSGGLGIIEIGYAAAKLSFFGATAVVQQGPVADAAGGTNIDPEARATANGAMAILRNYGLSKT